MWGKLANPGSGCKPWEGPEIQREFDKPKAIPVGCKVSSKSNPTQKQMWFDFLATRTPHK